MQSAMLLNPPYISTNFQTLESSSSSCSPSSSTATLFLPLPLKVTSLCFYPIVLRILSFFNCLTMVQLIVCRHRASLEVEFPHGLSVFHHPAPCSELHGIRVGFCFPFTFMNKITVATLNLI